MRRSRWQAPPWREPDLEMAYSGTLPANQCQKTVQNSNIRFKNDASGNEGVIVKFPRPAVF
jgi:hypothetical protein